MANIHKGVDMMSLIFKWSMFIFALSYFVLIYITLKKNIPLDTSVKIQEFVVPIATLLII